MVDAGKIVLFVFLLLVSSVIVFSQESNTTYNSSLISAVLVNPKYSVSQVDRFDLIINVSNISSCRYSYNPELNYSEIISPVNHFTATGKTQKITNFQLILPEGEKKTLYVLCQTPSGYVNNGFPIDITLGVDKTEPNILSAAAEPSYVIELPKTVLTVTTDDESVCRFDKSRPSEVEFLAFFSNADINDFSKENSVTLIPPNIEDNKAYAYTVSCMNRAGMFAPEIKVITFSVNLSAENKINLMLPSGFIRQNEVEVIVETNRDSTCRYALDSTNYASSFIQEHSKIHFTQKPNLLDNKTYTYNIRCEFDQGVPSVVDSSFSFIIDKTPPKSLSINTDSQSCSNNMLSANFTLNETDIEGIYFRLLDSLGRTVKDTTFSISLKVSLENLDLNSGEKYYWEAWATDKAGNNGTAKKSAGTLILSPESEECLPNMAPILKKQLKITESGITAALECSDEDGCQSIEYLLINSENPLCMCNSCNYTKYDLPIFGIKENTTLCYKLEDKKSIVSSGSFELKYENCVQNKTECCAGKIAFVCEQNCTVIKEKECDLTKIDSDFDGIHDTIEAKCGLNLNNASDALADFDKDGLTNHDECVTYNTDINKSDTDGDGYSDKEEIEKNTNPNDKKVFPKDLKKDTDKDGVPDYKETECGLDPNDAGDANADNDNDGLSNKEECLEYRTNIEDADTDGDKVTDKREVDAGTEPDDSSDYPQSNSFIIFLIVLLIGAIGAGAYFIIIRKGIDFGKFSGKKHEPKSPPEMHMQLLPNENKQQQKINVDFRQAKKELHEEVKQMPEKNPKETDLDTQIKKKKEWLRLRQMSSIFDEFGKEADEKKRFNEEDASGKAMPRSERQAVFDKLDEISKKDTLDSIKKKAKQGGDKP